jgi:site-specific recombinase
VRWLGAARAGRLSQALSGNVAALSGNVSLGVMLGVAPFIGRFFGLPFDVRHVTFSTGALALALAAAPASGAAIGGALAGVVLIGLLNLSVSFALALAVALRARDVRHGLRDLARAVRTRLRVTPRDFVWPPREPSVAGETLAPSVAPH